MSEPVSDEFTEYLRGVLAERFAKRFDEEWARYLRGESDWTPSDDQENQP